MWPLGWLLDQAISTGENALVRILSAGPIPQHIAFVMDGNRRYARMNHKQVHEGHSDGFLALRRVLRVCLQLGVRSVTVYAFSIENFKRPKDEVDALMKLAEEKLLELCSRGDFLQEYDVRLNVLGNVKMLPEAVQAAVRQAESMTHLHSRATLNLCMPYTSRDEITLAVQSTVRHAMESDPVMISQISEKTIEANLMTSMVGSPPLDILVRTSGVKRLSDFMLWQCNEDTQLRFTSTYWPDFGLLDLVPIVLDYQRKVWSQA